MAHVTPVYSNTRSFHNLLCDHVEVIAFTLAEEMTGTDCSQRFALIGVGFNDFGQLGPEGDANGGSFKLMSFASLPKLHVSSAWDSTYALATEESGTIQRAARGRWASMIPLIEQELCPRENAMSIMETSRDVMVILTTNGRVIAVERGSSNGSCKLNMAVSETVDVVSLAARGSGGAYVICRDGRLCTCEITRAPLRLALGVHIPLRVPVLSVACGADHTLLLTATRLVMSFGVGTRGQLGHGDIMNRKEPTMLEALDGVPMAAIACGLWHSMALSECGDIYSWGWNDHAQVKPSPQADMQPVVAVPTLIDPGAGDEEFCSISCGARHSAALTKRGRVYVWGWGYYGQLPDMSTISVSCRAAVCGHWNTFLLIGPQCR